MSSKPTTPRPIPPHTPGMQPPPLKNVCRCPQPIRNPHLEPVGKHSRCARCLLAMIGDQVSKAIPHHQATRKHGSSSHRAARIQKFEAKLRKNAEKRKRAKKHRR